MQAIGCYVNQRRKVNMGKIKHMVLVNDWPLKGTRRLKTYNTFEEAKRETSNFLNIHVDYDNQLFIVKISCKYTLIINNHPTSGNSRITSFNNYDSAVNEADNFLNEHIDMENELIIINGEIVHISQRDI